MALGKNILLFILTAILCLPFSHAQKRKKKKHKKTANTSVHLSPDKQLKLEGILIEGQKYIMLENNSKALEKFTEAIKLHSRCAIAHCRISQIYSNTKQVNEAILHGKKAIELKPKNIEYHISLAKVYKSANLLKDAINSYEKALEIQPNHEETLLETAYLYQLIGDQNSMMKIFDLVEERLGVREPIVREKQKIYMMRGKPDLVILEYQKLIKAYPNNSQFRVELIDFLVQNNKMAEAETELSKFKNEGNLPSKLLLLKSEILWKQNQHTKALELLEEGLKTKVIPFDKKFQILSNYYVATKDQSEKAKLNKIAIQLADQYPKEYKAQAYAGDLLYQMGKQNEATKKYLKALRLKPENANVWQNVLNIESNLQQYDSVTTHAEQALEYFPNQAIFYYFAGSGYSAKKNYKKAIRMLERGQKYASDNKLKTIFLAQLGDIYHESDNKQKAYESYEKVLKIDPNNDHVLNNYSYFLSVAKKELKKALQMSSKLVELQSENATYLDTHGWVLYVMKDYKKAVVFLEKAHQLDKDGTIAEHYGDVLFQLGQKEKAISLWQLAKNAGGTSKLIDKKIADKKLYE